MSINRPLGSDIDVRHVPIDGTNYILAAGTTDVDSSAIDLSGFNDAVIIMTVGVIASSGDVTANLAHSDNGTDWDDIADSSISLSADTDDDKMLRWNIFRPTKRYVRVETVRGDGGNSTINGIHAILSGARSLPITPVYTAGQHEAVVDIVDPVDA